MYDKILNFHSSLKNLRDKYQKIYKLKNPNFIPGLRVVASKRKRPKVNSEVENDLDYELAGLIKKLHMEYKPNETLSKYLDLKPPSENIGDIFHDVND